MIEIKNTSGAVMRAWVLESLRPWVREGDGAPGAISAPALPGWAR